MAESDEWFVGEDGCLSIEKPVDNITYHPNLNTILVSTKEPGLYVLDVTSGSVLKTSDLSACRPCSIKSSYLSGKDVVLFTDETGVCMRKDANGILLLDSALQAPVSKTEDTVKVELSLPEATKLFKCLMSAELPGVDYVEDVLRELEKEIEIVKQDSKANHKVAMWATVCLKLPHCALKTVCSSLVMELKRLHHHVPGLPIASAVADRLSYLLPSAMPDISGGTIDRTLMYSEAARRETFAKWPHMNYKWALPDAMAQAGFYHQPTSTGDDRAMCFTCNVCLVCWEPTDEPWSEHERHSPSCPFVKGEHTQNVPLSVTYSTEPALPHGAKGSKDKIMCVSTTSCDDFIATSTLNGNIVVWNLTRQLKKHIQFNLDPWDSVIAAKLGLQPIPHKDGSPKKLAPAPVNTLAEDAKQSSNEEKVEAAKGPAESASDNKIKADASPLDGAWKAAKKEAVVDVPLDSPEPLNKRCVLQRCRPSQDVLVSALCVLGAGEPDAEKKGLSSTVGGSSGSSGGPVTPINSSTSCSPHPCLLSGVAIRRSTMSEADLAEDQVTDVQAMNEVNQAISGESTPHIIDDSDSNSSTSQFRLTKPNPFVPYLLVHEIGTTKSRRELKGKVAAEKVPSSAGSSGTKVSSLASTVQDLYMPQMPQIMEIDEEGSLVPTSVQGVNELEDYFKTIPPLVDDEDDDVQIVGMQIGHYQVADWKMMNGPGLGPMAMPPPVETKTVITDNSLTIPSVMGPKEGRVRQCIELPSQVTSDQYIVSITPTLDSTHVIVVTAPKWQHKVISLASGSLDIQESDASDLSATQGSSVVSDSSYSAVIGNKGGCLLVYKVAIKGNVIGIEEKPVQTSVIENPDDAIQSLILLPPDVSSGLEEEELSPSEVEHDVSGSGLEEIAGQVALITYSGVIKILRLADCKVLAKIFPPEGDQFVSLTYCTGMNRLCGSTKQGKLMFYLIAPRVDYGADCDFLMDDLQSKNSSQVKDDSVDGYPEALYKTDDLLVKQALTTENLILLHDLTQFENLMPRFSATVPPCWSEIQQEQQQRRHPQHLQQQGEAMQHTRTWRLQQDGTSWDEHLFEVVLPKSCSVGHIDFKFTLHPFCLNAPYVEVTLLKKNLNSIGRVMFDKSSLNEGCREDCETSAPDDLDTGQGPSTAENASTFPHNPSSSSSSMSASFGNVIKNTVLDPQFLKHYGADILCGPVDLRNHLDMSGHSGLITLTSPQLLKTKTRSFLVHMKAMSAAPTNTMLSDKEKAKWSVPPQASDKAKEMKSSVSKPIWDDPVWLGLTPTTPATDRLATSLNKHKIDQCRGCDWIQEVSVTIRRTKKAPVARERLQRIALLETGAIHEQLLVAACGVDEKMGVVTSKEHRQGLALDILIWITSLQMNERFNKYEKSCVLYPVQNNLKGLVKSCFIEAGRSVAHKCAKLIALAIEYAKNLNEENLATSFNYSLLQALLDILPYIPCAYSAGALRWYFTLLNRVKCMDVSAMGNKCAELLFQVAKHYKDRIHPLHSLLKTRFGLYGSPLDPSLFDVDPPSLAAPVSTACTYWVTQTPSGNVLTTTSSSMGGGGGAMIHGNMAVPAPNMASTSGMATSSASATVTSSAVQDEVDLRDLMMTGSGSEKSAKSQFSYIQRHVFGLLEVEPLHFSCHAASDGTRMERMDSVGATSTTTSALSGLSGTINFGEALQGPPSATAALAHLSSALTSAEQQLQMLQQKQQQLYKIQQKLYGAGGSKSMPGSAQSASPSSSYTPYSSEFLPPPTPKTTPLFMTPPVTPPNESLLQVFNQAEDPGKPPLSKKSAVIVNKLNDVKDHMKSHSSSGKSSSQCQTPPSRNTLPIAQTHNLLQPPPPQVLVIDRMHSGARRFVVLDFGKPILLTDVIIPACNDLASLSIDVWVQAEEQDGQRLVVSSDIGQRSLIMNDLMPPPVCRYLKITTIGRYGGSTTKSRIPIGSFYGYTTILPWECESNVSGGSGSTNNNVNASVVMDHSQIFSRLGTLLGLQEDLQCRYSLASNRLMSLLNTIDTPLNNNSHTHYYLRKSKKLEDDARIQQAYQDCIQLQQQLNLVQHAAERLQKVLGLHHQTSAPQSTETSVLLKQASTDKLRVLVELLLDSLLGMSNPSPSIPRLPVSIFNFFTPQTCESLFRNLCINGTRRMQIHTGLLLVRLCGNSPWWGEFLGSMLQQYFSSEQPEIFPQDRVFVLLTALGQKAAAGSRACEMLENILLLLGKLVSPLVVPSNTLFRPNAAQLDLSLIGWLLLFLTRNLDNAPTNSSSIDDGDRGASSSKDKDGNGNGNSRWDFLQGETAMANSRQSSRGSSSKVYRRKLQKRLMHHKQQLLDLQQAKKTFMSMQMETSAAGGLSKETEALLKQQEQIFKKQIKQYSSKHFKDIMQIRRIDGELLKKMPKGQEAASGGADKDAGDADGDVNVVISREKCVPVVRGLMALLLSMDFTCNVDLFLITCKVVARLANVTRPAISLSEVMSQEELERLVMLCCNVEFNHGNVTWGGSWAGHAITCLLQDILDGEKMYPAFQASEAVTDDDMSGYSDSDTPMQSNTNLAGMDADASSPSTSAAAAAASAPEDVSEATATSAAAAASTGAGATGKSDDATFKFDKESSLIVDMILDDKENDEALAKVQDYLSLTGDLLMGKWNHNPKSIVNIVNYAPSSKGTINCGLPPPITFGDEKKQKFESWKSKLTSLVADSTNLSISGVSTAMDSRLEIGVDLAAELRLKVMMSLETDSIHNAISAPLPPPPIDGHVNQAPNSEDDSMPDMTAAFLHQQKIIASHEMLSICFNHLFSHLQMQRVNLETLLLTWLTLNDESTGEDSNQLTPFDPSKVPFITLQPAAVSSLLAALAMSPSVPVRTWVLAFHTLSLLANTKFSSSQSSSGLHHNMGMQPDRWMANVMVSDPNLMKVLLKFLSSSMFTSTSPNASQTCQVGPTGTRAFHEFLVRLQLRCADSNENQLKELILTLVYTLSTDRGAFHSALGPLDAQCKLLDYMVEQSYDSVDVNNALSVIESLSMLVYQHIICQEKVICRSTSENSVSARSCFGGLFASMLRAPDTKTATGDTSRDVLMCSLLKLVNKLVQIPVPGRGTTQNRRGNNLSMGETTLPGPEYMEDSLMTDSSKISQSFGGTFASTSANSGPKSDEEKYETDEQKTESNNRTQSCSHYADVRNPQNSSKEVTVSDVVLQHPQIMGFLIQALSCCNSNTMAMILGSSNVQGNMQISFNVIDPISVGDGIFHILSTLNKKATDVKLIVSHVMQYLASGFQGSRYPGISRLSEPLLWFILRVLDCDNTIRHFLDLGGVEIVCQNLVQSSHQVISVNPSLISTMMQYLGNSKTSSASIALKKSTTDTETGEELQNFAPICTVTSSSPTAGPADVLIQASPPHRRARSAAWSYHFYPEEAWVDLTLTLPCAVLLKEIHIQPHLTSLATCPAAVSVEVSRDGTTCIPICSPIQTSGLTLVKLQLLKSEVVTSVTIRLHKPRDSTTIGLSKIMLLGSTAFADSGPLRTANFLLPSEDYVSKSSIGWLRLLHHCLVKCEAEISGQVAGAAAQTSGLLVTCTALLVSSSAVQLYATNIEAVLLRIGLHSNEMGLVLIEHILRNTNLAPHHRDMPLHGKVNGVSNDSTVDILFKLGTRQGEGTEARVKALLDWLSDSARVGLQKSSASSSPSSDVYSGHSGQQADLPTPAPGHIHCIAAVLWHSHELPVSYSLQALLTRDMLSCLYEWSVTLPVECSLKKAVNSVICSMCYVHPEYFTYLLEWMGVVVQLDMNAALTDDHKDSRHIQPLLLNQESMTDDSKEATGVAAASQGSYLLHLTLTNLMLDESHLSTLAVACQSPQALQQLLGYGFPAILCQGLYEFCMREAAHHQDHLINMDIHPDSAKNISSQGCSGSSSPSQTYSDSRHRNDSESSHLALEHGLYITSDLVSPVLRFFAEVSKEAVMKDWLGSPKGAVFWPNMLQLLCNTMSHTNSSQQQGVPKTKAMNSEQRAAIETATVAFFTNVISCHPENQQTFATVLCDVIRAQPAATNSFTRRLFLQVLLEDERVTVCMQSSTELYKGVHGGSIGLSCLGHPRCGAGHCFRTIHASLQTTCSDLLSKVSDTPSLTTQLLEERAERRSSEDKDASQRGLEVVDLISAAAGLQAKEKRDKDKLGNNPPRPPSRRGHRPPDQGMSVGVSLPCLTLHHLLLSGQGLPGDLTLSQLLVLLHERGFAHGQSTIELHLRVKGRKKAEGRQYPGEDTNAEDALLATPCFPSALQVFAGVGGLALLAEHLPLLYPEVLRQVSPPSTANENSTGNALQNDWVTVESAEDIYEDIYEPMPTPHLGSSSKPSSQMFASIPPHSLVAFGLFLRLPGYAEVLLKERKRAQCLLRLVLGVTDDGQGGHILTSPVSSALPTLPFNVLKTLYDTTPLTTDDGVLLRRMALEIGVIHLLLACLSVLSHQAPRSNIPGIHQEGASSSGGAGSTGPGNGSAGTGTGGSRTQDEKGQNYWAKGTGFGTGSTTSSWDAEQAFLRQRSEEEHVTCLLQVLSSYINPGGLLPKAFDPHADPEEIEEEEDETRQHMPEILSELLSHSCLVPAISSYLRNDSVLDMARHVPLYRALLELLRALAVSTSLVWLLLPLESEEDTSSISSLLIKMKNCVDTYANRLKSNKNKGNGINKNKQEEEESEGLALLIPDIQETARIVHISTSKLRRDRSAESVGRDDSDNSLTQPGAVLYSHSDEERYISTMKELQFDTYEIVTEEDGVIKFNAPHHYESNVKAAGDVNNASRARRLAQEAVTLSTSLPLSASSSVFVRCDEERLDVMKVLITGPSDTPYANGCFEFDVYFPQDYPNSPPLINLETTGNHTVRFNPNLYNDGKVCLSVLNTWHGRPEEKWNSQTSSFLQVLVSIQSLILVPEPYFNEPGYERSRGTPSGTASSREYDANIRQATVKWAMLEQLRNPSPCFKEVIEHHFWLKRHEITSQIDAWSRDMETGSTDKRSGRTITHSAVALKRHYNQLKEEFVKMRPPKDLEEDVGLHEAEMTLEQLHATPILSASVEVAQGVNDLPLPDFPISNPPPLLAAEASKAWFPPEKMPVKHVMNGPKVAPAAAGVLENDLDEKDNSSSSESTNTDQSMTSSPEDYHSNIKC